VSSVAGWKSPVLLIHGDDDRNVRFSQSTDLVRRLAAAGVPFETLVIQTTRIISCDMRTF